MTRKALQFPAAILFISALIIIGIVRVSGKQIGGSDSIDRVGKVKTESRKVSFTDSAEEKIRIGVFPVREVLRNKTLSIAGELVPAPGRSVTVTAAFTGTIRKSSRSYQIGQRVEKDEVVFLLVPTAGVQRDLKTTLTAELDSASARFESAKQQLTRAKVLFEGKATSKKSLELAEQEYNQAKALHIAAEKRLKDSDLKPFDADVELTIKAPIGGVLRQLPIVDGQTVGGGTVLFEIVDLDSLWLKVPVYAGYADTLKDISTISIKQLGSQYRVQDARLVTGPPTADPLTFTVDLYFEISNRDYSYKPGEKLVASIPLKTEEDKVLSVPRSAVIYDTYGSEWVYVASGGNSFLRQRIETWEITDTTAYIKRGLHLGQSVVESGAAELFGSEEGMGEE